MIGVKSVPALPNRYSTPRSASSARYAWATLRDAVLSGAPLIAGPAFQDTILFLPLREVVWVILDHFSNCCLLLLLSLWACGQRACVVHPCPQRCRGDDAHATME